MATGKHSASDLDIFGEAEKDGEGSEAESTDNTDIFNGKEADEAEAPKKDETKEDVKEDSKSEKKTTEEKPETKPDDTKEKVDAKSETAPADPELEKLFKDLEAEASKKKADQAVIESLVDDLRKEVAMKDSEIMVLKKRCDALQEKIMSGSDSETDWKIYEPLVKKLEEQPKLMILSKLWGSTDEKAKTRMIRTASELLTELTGQDVSELIDSKAKDAVIGLTKRPSGKASEEADEEKENAESDEDEPEVNKIMNF
jgi:hypothetical protein